MFDHIINPDYMIEQTGETYPAMDVSYAEFDYLDQLIEYVNANSLNDDLIKDL